MPILNGVLDWFHRLWVWLSGIAVDQLHQHRHELGKLVGLVFLVALFSVIITEAGGGSGGKKKDR